MGNTANTLFKASILLAILGALYACTDGNGTRGTDPGDPDQTPGGEVAEQVPEPVKGFGEAVVVLAEVGKAPPAGEERRRPSIATPPLPSAASSVHGMSGGGASSRVSGRRSRGILGGLGGATADEASAAPMAAAPPAPAKMSSSAPSGGGGASRDRSSASSLEIASPGFGPGASAAYGSPAPRRQQIARRLTAAAVADVDHREAYRSYLARHAGEAASLRLDLSRRVRILVVDSQDRPVHDARITVLGNGARVTGRTHADGYWDLFPSFQAPALYGQATVYVEAGTTSARVLVNVPAQGDGLDHVVRLPAPAAASPRQLDLAFLIDVTGSMSDELRYVNQEVTGIVDRVRAAVPGVDVRVAATFYRDRNDSVPVEQIPFSSDTSGFTARMQHVRASGGGDYPEDLDSGLAAALHTLAWSRERAVRVLVVIADAPPQHYQDAQYHYADAMRDASARGIRLLPVAASGANRTVEYLFRAMGTVTSSPYVYLTDDSGVGNAHMEADSDHVSREMFSDMLTRFLIAELQGEGMHA